jgi:hypothetical protein
MDTSNTPEVNLSPPCRPQNCESKVVICDADLDDIIPGYLEGKRKECLLLRALAEKRGFEEIRGIAHGMKGSGGCYGFSVISEIGRVMEAAAKTGDLHDVLEQTDALEAYLDSVEVRYE